MHLLSVMRISAARKPRALTPQLRTGLDVAAANRLAASAERIRTSVVREAVRITDDAVHGVLQLEAVHTVSKSFLKISIKPRA